jgi:hypothetical protein
LLAFFDSIAIYTVVVAAAQHNLALTNNSSHSNEGKRDANTSYE